MTTTITVQDAVTFTVLKSDLTKNAEEYVETPEQPIPCSDDLKWLVRYYPTGRKLDSTKTFCVYLQAKEVTDAKMNVAVDGFGEKWPANKMAHTTGGWIRFIKLPHEQFLMLFKDDELTITCSVEFDITAPLTMHAKPHLFESCDHVPTDFELVVGSDRLPVHKSFLSFISPVFHAMFSHDTAESRSGQVEITDFDYGTVKAAIDFCYGRQLQNPDVASVIDILRFADKYDIKALTNPLERMSLSVDNFCAIVHYAHDCSRLELLTKCNNFYKEHEDDINDLEEFGKLAPSLVNDLLKAAFSLATTFDVLRHAHKTGLTFVVTHLEQPLLDSLTLDDFCPTVKYAWEHSRDDLKKVCAKFLNEHRLEVTTKHEFVDLSSDVVRDVLKLSLLL